MNAQELYVEAVKRGVRLEPRGDKLAVIFSETLPPGFTDILRQHKVGLLDWLSRLPCPGWQAVPPPDLPFNPIHLRPTLARREAVIGYLRRQGTDQHCPLAEWLARRECAYYDGPGRRWDCALHAYAAARDAACWQLSRSETDVWQFLEATAETFQRMKKGGKSRAM